MVGKTVKYESGYGVFEGVVIEEFEDFLIVESESIRFGLPKRDILEVKEWYYDRS